MNKEDKNIDDTFRDAFSEFRVTPPMKNWEGVEEDINADIDERFGEKLKSLEVIPQKQVWENIKEELPLHPEARRYFSWMNKVAAVLVIGMLLSILSDQQKQQFALEEDKIAIDLTIQLQTENPERISIENPSNDFVYELSKHHPDGHSTTTLEAEEEAEIKNLLQFILEDDEDLARQIDSAVIRKGFAPVSAPSDETATANLKKSQFVIPEFEIKIPLKVVETEQEVNDLLRMYDAKQASAKALD